MQKDKDTKLDSKFFTKKIEFVLGVASLQDLPLSELPEIAFIGRSNVGKSSLINALVNQKVARISNTPGRTQQLNFFNLDDSLHIVDLPGYGYAKAKKSEVKGWNKLIMNYLKGRIQLKKIFLLIDSRHGIKTNDLEMIKFLGSCAVVTHIVLTKTDKLKKSEFEAVIKSTTEEVSKHAILHNDLIVTSSEKKLGIEELRNAILDVVESA